MTDWMDTLTFTPNTGLSITATYNSRGEAPVNSSSSMIGQKIGTVKCNLSTTNAPDGTLYCEVRDTTDNSLKYSIGEISFSSLVGSDITFESTTASYTLTQNDTICLRAVGLTGIQTIEIRRSDGTDAYDGTNSGRSYWNGSSWGVESSEDWLALFTDSEGPSGGTRLPPPPLVVHF